MQEFIKELLQARLDTLFVLAGLAFIGIAIVGNISGRIQPGKAGRIASAVVGPVLIIAGLWLHSDHPNSESATPQTPPAASGTATGGQATTPEEPRPPNTGVTPPGVHPPAVLPVQIEYFASGWKNADEQTRGITRLQIRVDGDHPWVHTWGKCHPTDCDWGEVKATAYAPNVSSHEVRSVSAIYRTSFSETNLTLSAEPEDALRAETTTHFTDASGRSDYSASFKFHRAH